MLNTNEKSFLLDKLTPYFKDSDLLWDLLGVITYAQRARLLFLIQKKDEVEILSMLDNIKCLQLMPTGERK